MKISTEIYSAAQHIGEERAIEYIAKAGLMAGIFQHLPCVCMIGKKIL